MTPTHVREEDGEFVLLEKEARWLGAKINSMDPQRVFPLCNVGSSTLEFRTVHQPYIDRYIFAPAREAGREVKHMDIKAEPGVDVVGDLSDPAFLAELRKMEFKSLICSNLLEHVENRPPICESMLAMLPSGGLLFVTCPKDYPFHPDPIDTLFRPSVEELAALFPGTDLVEGEIVPGETFRDVLNSRPQGALKWFGRMMLPFLNPSSWKRQLGYWPYLSRPFSATCIILQKR